MALHPIIQHAIERAYRRGHGELHLKSVEEVRAYYYRHNIENAKVPYQDFPLPSGAFIRIYSPSSSREGGFPLIIYLRANAYILGSADDSNVICYQMAQQLHAKIAVIAPRLAPEHPFPALFEDGVRAIQYLQDHQQALNICEGKIAVWGESSGSHFAVTLSHYFAQQKCDWIKRQVLFYPPLDCNPAYGSKEKYGQGYLMDLSFFYWSMKHYVPQGNYDDPRISPLLSDNFEGLPSTLLIGAQYDPFLDEQAIYISKLKEANVPVEAIFIPGMIHGFTWYVARIEEARWACNHALSFLKSFILT